MSFFGSFEQKKKLETYNVGLSFFEALKYKRTLWGNFFVCQQEKRRHLYFFLISVCFLFCLMFSVPDNKQETSPTISAANDLLTERIEKAVEIKRVLVGEKKTRQTATWLMFQNSRCLNSLWPSLDALESFGLEFSFREMVIAIWNFSTFHCIFSDDCRSVTFAQPMWFYFYTYLFIIVILKHDCNEF